MSSIDNPTDQLERTLNSFDAPTRVHSLTKLLTQVQHGAQSLPEPQEVANMHAHTFFSFNAYGYSPAALAWHGRKAGLKLMGIVDFDVLDGVDEWIWASDLVGLRGSAGLETRVFIPEFADTEINSPGEPGVAYHMGIGFTSSQIPPTTLEIADDLKNRASARNRALVNRVNAYLHPVTLDYERDVLPLTPKGNATERHIVLAYIRAAQRQLADPVAFWAEKLEMPPKTIQERMGNDGDAPAFQNIIRKKLMKRGGVGYVQPSPHTFPNLDTFHRLITACGAIPCAAWLDGESEGEQRMDQLLEMMIAQGVAAINIIPDRNWNIADPTLQQRKLENLYQLVDLAQQLDLPLHIGTEMNSFGQKFVDDFDAPPLAPLRQTFLDGAYFVYGHVMMQRALGRGYQSPWTHSHLPSRRDRNDFFSHIGHLIPPGPHGLRVLRRIDPDLSPAAILTQLEKQQPSSQASAPTRHGGLTTIH